jgi:hypothetical protein
VEPTCHRPCRQASRAHWPSGAALPCCSTGRYNMHVSEVEAATALSERPHVTGKELAALSAAVSHDAAPPCRSCRTACRPRSLLVIVPELHHSSSSHVVRIAAPDGHVRTQLVRAPKPASHRSAVRRPVSGLNRRPECFLQTSTLASSPGRPEPFPGCLRDHVRVHLHERCCTFATGRLTPLYSYCRRVHCPPGLSAQRHELAA